MPPLFAYRGTQPHQRLAHITLVHFFNSLLEYSISKSRSNFKGGEGEAGKTKERWERDVELKFYEKSDEKRGKRMLHQEMMLME